MCVLSMRTQTPTFKNVNSFACPGACRRPGLPFGLPSSEAAWRTAERYAEASCDEIQT
jgi:hypothetical protein